MKQVELLVSEGADLSFYEEDYIEFDHKKLHYTPLMYAIEQQNPPLAVRLIELGAPIDADPEQQNSPLIVAIHCYELGLIELLLKKDADANRKCCSYYDSSELWSPFFWAAFWDMHEVMEILLNYPVDVNEQCFPFQDTALHKAVYYQNVEMIDLLLNMEQIQPLPMNQIEHQLRMLKLFIRFQSDKGIANIWRTT